MNHPPKLEAYYNKIYKYCYYKLQNKNLAEDITQETFLHFIQKEHYCAVDIPLNLLYTIAHNLCIDECRRKSAASLEAIELPDAVLPTQPDHSESILFRHSLQNALHKLEEIERDIIFLHLVNGETFANIANTLHLSRYTVYRKYAHATNILRKVFE